MLEELSRRLDDYAVANGHTLQTVVWYGSTTEKWGMTQTLRHLIAEYKPTYLWVCLGGNELFVRDLEERDAYIKLLLAQAGDLPMVWIGPPCWKSDTGINDLIRRNVGDGSFFDSSQLTLKRKKDGRHPTHQAAADWGDQVAAWMQSEACDQPLAMRRPDKAAPLPHAPAAALLCGVQQIVLYGFRQVILPAPPPLSPRSLSCHHPRFFPRSSTSSHPPMRRGPSRP